MALGVLCQRIAAHTADINAKGSLLCVFVASPLFPTGMTYGGLTVC